MQSIVDSFLVWWLRSGRYGWSWLRRRLFERRYLTTVLPTVNSLEEIEACLRQITWTMDGPLHLFDCISYPHVTWAKKKDDCDGFSSLAAELLNRWNPNCNPVLVTAMVRPIRDSHTVCVCLLLRKVVCGFSIITYCDVTITKHIMRWCPGLVSTLKGSSVGMSETLSRSR